MSRHVVIGVDPGRHSGWAVLGVTLGSAESAQNPPGYNAISMALQAPQSASVTPLGMPEASSVAVIGTGTIEIEVFPAEFAALLQQAADAWPDAQMHVVVERFVVTKISLIGQALFSVEVLGMVKSELYHFFDSLWPVDIQTPGNAKSIMTNTKIKAAGIKTRGMSDHAVDALRHALLKALTIARV